MLGFEEVAAEGLRLDAEPADVGIQVERALRFDLYAKPQPAQGRQQVIAASLELGPALFEDRHGLGREAGQCGVLGHARGADVEVLRQFLQRRHRARWRYQPAQAPAGHAEVLGEAVQHERLVVDLQHARRIQAIGQSVIDLVDHQVTATRAQGRR